MINVTNDPGDGVCYVRISATPIANTVQLKASPSVVNVDYDNDGNVVGVEFLA